MVCRMARRKKILWLIKGLGLGGAEKLLVLALPHLNQQRFDYEACYFLPWKNALVQDLQTGNIPVFCLDQRRHFDPRVVIKLARLLRERSPDLVHMHLPYAAIVGRMAARLSGVKATIYTEHNVFDRYNWLTALAHKKTLSWNDAVICVAEAVRSSVMGNCHPGPSTRVVTIHNGFNWQDISCHDYNPAAVRSEFGIPDEHAIVAQVASFTPKKRHQDLLSAAKSVLDKQPQTTFLLVGQGPLFNQTKEAAQTLGILDHMVFTGTRNDALRLMAASDVVTLSSEFEALPVCILEAMALERPVVATRVGGVPEVIINGGNGILVEPKNSTQLAEGILSLLRSPELRSRLGRQARKTIRQQFDLRNMVARVEAMYDEVLTAKGSA